MRRLRNGRAVRLSASVLAALLASLYLTSAALAYRPATGAETKAMVYRASGRYYGNMKVSEPRAAPLRCFVADIATVVRGSRWGAWTFSRYADHHELQCRTGNGISITHKIRNRWYVFWEGSEGYPPTHTQHGGPFPLQGVPRAVAKDLVKGLTG